MINPYLNGSRFQASDKGEIWNKNFRKLTPRPDDDGYLVLRDEEANLYFAHEVVFASFHEKPKDMIVLFLDGDKSNLHLSNLSGVRINDPDLTSEDSYLKHFARRQFINDETYAQAVYEARLKEFAPKTKPEPSPISKIVSEPVIVPNEPSESHPAKPAPKASKPKAKPKPKAKLKSDRAKVVEKGVGGFRNRLLSD